MRFENTGWALNHNPLLKRDMSCHSTIKYVKHSIGQTTKTRPLSKQYVWMSQAAVLLDTGYPESPRKVITHQQIIDTMIKCLDKPNNSDRMILRHAQSNHLYQPQLILQKLRSVK